MRAIALLVSVLVISCAPVRAAHGQVQDDVIVDGVADIPGQQQNQIFIQDETFDQWLYGIYGSANDVQQRFNAQLHVHLDDIERLCEAKGVPLSESQKKKMQLAARGDIERFQQRVAKARAKFDLVRNDQNRINEIFQDIQPLQLRMQAGLFGEGSLFEKTVVRVLNEKQQGPRSELLEERRKYRYQAQIGIAIAIMESGLPLVDEQRGKLADLIAKETQPPKTFSQYDYYYVMLQLSKIPKEKVLEVLDETQWKLLQPYLDQAKGMEPFLNQQEQQIDGGAIIPGGLF